MHIERIYLQANFQSYPGENPFLYKHIGIGLHLNEGDDLGQAEETAQAYIQDFIVRNTHFPEHQHIETRTIPDIQVEKKTTVDYLIEDIEKCETIQELETFFLMTRSNEKLEKAYHSKYDQLFKQKIP